MLLPGERTRMRTRPAILALGVAAAIIVALSAAVLRIDGASVSGV